MMVFELNVTVYSRWPWASADSRNWTRPSGLATVTSAAEAVNAANRASARILASFRW